MVKTETILIIGAIIAVILILPRLEIVDLKSVMDTATPTHSLTIDVNLNLNERASEATLYVTPVTPFTNYTIQVDDLNKYADIVTTTGAVFDTKKYDLTDDVNDAIKYCSESPCHTQISITPNQEANISTNFNISIQKFQRTLPQRVTTEGINIPKPSFKVQLTRQQINMAILGIIIIVLLYIFFKAKINKKAKGGK